ncbi:shikimate kinase [Magnetospira sp. QH-2]|uniref:shikimate kinase n=1 Tax=Magnetospira sp. (strain QH-2) TaxID=1288970 RepID=UPI0005F9DD49|nr:shikimate kinase [Magnetospira sp. QH-2]
MTDLDLVTSENLRQVVTLLAPRSVVLVGLMGAGKSAVGRRLAARLSLPFVDADAEIEKAAGCSIADIFETYGEEAFRDCERRVIRRLLGEPSQVLATGGGAFMNPETRSVIKKEGLSLWLRAPLHILVERTSRRDTRPLLRTGNPSEILQDLMNQRYPVYGQSDLVVDTTEESADHTTELAIHTLFAYLSSTQGETPTP